MSWGAQCEVRCPLVFSFVFDNRTACPLVVHSSVGEIERHGRDVESCLPLRERQAGLMLTSIDRGPRRDRKAERMVGLVPEPVLGMSRDKRPNLHTQKVPVVVNARNGSLLSKTQLFIGTGCRVSFCVISGRGSGSPSRNTGSIRSRHIRWSVLCDPRRRTQPISSSAGSCGLHDHMPHNGRWRAGSTSSGKMSTARSTGST